ncbi:uncharacterized protein EV154DRAFT_416559 [Mucor mucedo]|uniref:uncharacterized protein n=1 Tax=Mucor mucedo TaxID=29922 RepID=UPI00221E50B3|nr:uncharacterized protein EV154DRAFT_416559 [Mucor mucedo]KAI7893603.1 hypothetical protein EV154DRAFT_416559 [Mucor mucedo]
MNPPEHPGNPKWQVFNDWVKIKPSQSIDYKKNQEETIEESFERFGLEQEDGDWGDASEAQDAGWGTSTGSGW